MFWFAVAGVAYVVAVGATLTFVYSAGALNARADQKVKQFIQERRQKREVA